MAGELALSEAAKPLLPFTFDMKLARDPQHVRDDLSEEARKRENGQRKHRDPKKCGANRNFGVLYKPPF
jgi:hypothetical protein